jgi:hypothetical protein
MPRSSRAFVEVLAQSFKCLGVAWPGDPSSQGDMATYERKGVCVALLPSHFEDAPTSSGPVVPYQLCCSAAAGTG